MLLRGQECNFEGKHYTITGLKGSPRPRQGPRPPICVGGGGPKTFATKSAADRWLATKRSDLDRAFTISQTDYERIAGKTREMLIGAPAADAADSEDASA